MLVVADASMGARMGRVALAARCGDGGRAGHGSDGRGTDASRGVREWRSPLQPSHCGVAGAGRQRGTLPYWL